MHTAEPPFPNPLGPEVVQNFDIKHTLFRGKVLSCKN